MEQISIPLDKNIENLMKQLENQHRDLLYQQLLCIKREYTPQTVTCLPPDTAAVTINSSNTQEGKAAIAANTELFTVTQTFDSSTDQEGKAATAANTELFTVTQAFDTSTDQEEDEQDSEDISAQENEESIKLEESADNSASVMCINYSSLPIDSAGNFQVTHHLNPQGESCSNGEEETESEPSPKRFKAE
jgi:hypothetical protein